tara:strand:- start:20814 stop:21041 length:228 start_codon:yes stop_codon:yes gene_type:complete
VIKDKKAAAALARKRHHTKQIGCKKRIDAYVNPETKAGLAALKAHLGEIKNEGQAIDHAVALALKSLDESQKSTV